jgi:hypothetical protein
MTFATNEARLLQSQNARLFFLCALCAMLFGPHASAEQICNDKAAKTNVRQGPSAKNYPAIDNLPNGTAVQVLERVTNPEGHDYLKIQFQHSTSGTLTVGWVYYLAIADACSSAANSQAYVAASASQSVAGSNQKDLEDELKRKDAEIQRLRAERSSGQSSNESQVAEEIIAKLEKRFPARVVHDTIRQNSYSSCINSVYETSEYKATRDFPKGKESSCVMMADTAAIAATGMTYEQDNQEQSRLFQDLCTIYHETKSTRIKNFFDAARGRSGASFDMGVYECFHR